MCESLYFKIGIEHVGIGDDIWVEVIESVVGNLGGVIVGLFEQDVLKAPKGGLFVLQQIEASREVFPSRLPVQRLSLFFLF